MGFFKSFSKSHVSTKGPRIYLDFASSTPLDQGMLGTFPPLSEYALQANPSALHYEGQQAKKSLKDARAVVAEALFAHDDEVIFTSNATESDNLALHGTVLAAIKNNVAKNEIAIITTDSEHSAVLETVKALSPDIATIILETDNGILDARSIEIPEGMKLVIVSVMYVNNEIGVVQPVYDIAKRIRFLRKNNPDVTILLHVDATQAPLHFSLNVQKLGVDMMTLGATKLYCPKGVGLLYLRRGTALAPIMQGGGQQFGLRPGTEPVQLIHDFAHSLAFAQNHVEQHSTSILKLRQHVESLIKKEIPQAVITAEHHERTPHISHVAFKNFDSELLVLELDARGIAVSAKSACKNDASRGTAVKWDVNESDIVERIYGQGWGAVRMSYGRGTTTKELKKVVMALQQILEKYR